MNKDIRHGRFTSSQAYRIVGTPAVRKTYIQEKAIERRLGSSLDGDAHSQAMAWGNFMELVVFNVLGLEYTIKSKETIVHSEYDFWAGSPDLIVPGKKVAEIKCYQKKKFCLYTDALLKGDIELIKNDFKQEYWQVVSNAIILGLNVGELITYMPYESEMEFIKDLAANHDGADQWKYRFIAEMSNENLPVLKDGGYYKNVNKFEFEIPKEDIQLLTEKMIEAENEIINY
jgi:hypothetical protein